MALQLKRTRRSEPGIPLASLSDLAMLLLIFFIICAQFLVERTLRAELPAITPDKSKSSEELVTVVVESQGVFLDEEHIAMDRLAPYLAAKLANKATPEERAVLLDARPQVPYEYVAMAANEIKRAGGIVTFMKVED